MKKNRQTYLADRINCKYSQLLGFLILVMFAFSLPITAQYRNILPILFVLGIIPAVHIVLPYKKLLLFMLFPICLISLKLVNEFMFTEPNGIINGTVLVLNVLCLFVAIIVLISDMRNEQNVTSDTIKGGISVFLLMGFMWTCIYYLLQLYGTSQDVEIFTNVNSNNSMNSLFYFSFTTLTTLGYGDIAPVSNAARLFANLEAIAGQVYLVVFIAMLMSRRLRNEANKK